MRKLLWSLCIIMSFFMFGCSKPSTTDPQPAQPEPAATAVPSNPSNPANPGTNPGGPAPAPTAVPNPGGGGTTHTVKFVVTSSGTGNYFKVADVLFYAAGAVTNATNNLDIPLPFEKTVANVPAGTALSLAVAYGISFASPSGISDGANTTVTLSIYKDGVIIGTGSFKPQPDSTTGGAPQLTMDLTL